MFNRVLHGFLRFLIKHLCTLSIILYYQRLIHLLHKRIEQLLPLLTAQYVTVILLLLLLLIMLFALLGAAKASLARGGISLH